MAALTLDVFDDASAGRRRMWHADAPSLAQAAVCLSHLLILAAGFSFRSFSGGAGVGCLRPHAS